MVTTTKTLLTLHDYLALPDEPRVELIEGELFVSPAPRFDHQNVVGAIFALLRSHVRERGLGIVVVSPFDVVLSEHDVVQPDLVFVAKAHRDRIQDRLRGPPDLAVEILSPGHAERDRIVKRDLYARSGVPEYWIIDVERRQIEVRQLEGDRYQLLAIFEEGDTLTSNALPDLELDVTSVFG